MAVLGNGVVCSSGTVLIGDVRQIISYRIIILTGQRSSPRNRKAHCRLREIQPLTQPRLANTKFTCRPMTQKATGLYDL